MEDLLHNPVYHALRTGDASLALGSGHIRHFDEEVSPFAGFPQDYTKGFDDLYEQLPPGRRILYATPGVVDQPKGWKIMAAIKGLQFILTENTVPSLPSITLVPLTTEHISEMVELATLTKPGPFGRRTIEFGHYHGVFENGKLVAMTGQRLHVGNYSEVSAVCTHPDYLGRGYAAALIQHQLMIIAQQGQQAFLHVRADNSRAIAIYERLGFKVSRNMNFYFMKKRN